MGEEYIITSKLKKSREIEIKNKDLAEISFKSRKMFKKNN